ncbi:MAG: phosphate signaling complex protein PhoU [Halovenus sp.]
MARSSYQERLLDLRGNVGAMADRALKRYDQSITVLETGDSELARRIIEGDRELNEWYLNIESECVELIALQQPVASDLRFITSSFKIVTDLERIGDLATNLAAYGRDAAGELLETVDVAPIATEAGEMARDAMEAYTTDNADQARDIAARDDQLDDQCRQASERVVRNLLTVDTRSLDIESTLEDVSRALLTVRDLERVGDHAVNICARTLYMVENDDELIY